MKMTKWWPRESHIEESIHSGVRMVMEISASFSSLLNLYYDILVLFVFFVFVRVDFLYGIKHIWCEIHGNVSLIIEMCNGLHILQHKYHKTASLSVCVCVIHSLLSRASSFDFLYGKFVI